MGLAFSHTAVVLSHTLQFACLMAVFTNLVQYYVYTGRAVRTGSHLNKYGPAYLVVLTFFLVMVHPTFIILKDANVGQGLRPSDTVVKACTYTGYGVLVVAAFWAAGTFAQLQQACCTKEEGDHRSE